MIESEPTLSRLPGSTRRFAQHALAAGENRLELLLVELREERERVFNTVGMLLGMATLAALAGIAFTFMIVVLLWDQSRVWPIITLTFLYAGGAALIYSRIKRRLAAWETLPETLSLLRRDCAALAHRLK